MLHQQKFKIACASLDREQHGNTGGSASDDTYNDEDDDSSRDSPVLSVSVTGRECQMTAEEVIGMSPQHFAALWMVMHAFALE